MNYYPTNPVKNASTISFTLPAWTSQTFYLLHEALLSVKLKILNSDGQKLPDDTRCAPANNIYGSIFQDCKIWFNDVQVSTLTQCYGYKNYIETTLNYNYNVKDSFLRVGGYVEDVYKMFDDCTGATNT
jgi:hypothetical protein